MEDQRCQTAVHTFDGGDQVIQHNVGFHQDATGELKVPEEPWHLAANIHVLLHGGRSSRAHESILYVVPPLFHAQVGALIRHDANKCSQ